MGPEAGITETAEEGCKAGQRQSVGSSYLTSSGLGTNGKAGESG